MHSPRFALHSFLCRWSDSKQLLKSFLFVGFVFFCSSRHTVNPQKDICLLLKMLVFRTRLKQVHSFSSRWWKLFCASSASLRLRLNCLTTMSTKSSRLAPCCAALCCYVSCSTQWSVREAPRTCRAAPWLAKHSGASEELPAYSRLG